MSDDLVKRLWLLDMRPESAPRQAADRIEALKAENERLRKRVEAADRAVEAANRLPPGEWEVWTACSFRRITARGGPDGGVLSGIIQYSDGHPDLSWNEKQCQALCDLVNGLRAAYHATEGVARVKETDR